MELELRFLIFWGPMDDFMMGPDALKFRITINTHAFGLVITPNHLGVSVYHCRKGDLFLKTYGFTLREEVSY